MFPFWKSNIDLANHVPMWESQHRFKTNHAPFWKKQTNIDLESHVPMLDTEHRFICQCSHVDIQQDIQQHVAYYDV